MTRAFFFAAVALLVARAHATPVFEVKFDGDKEGEAP